MRKRDSVKKLCTLFSEQEQSQGIKAKLIVLNESTGQTCHHDQRLQHTNIISFITGVSGVYALTALLANKSKDGIVIELNVSNNVTDLFSCLLSFIQN